MLVIQPACPCHVPRNVPLRATLLALVAAVALPVAAGAATTVSVTPWGPFTTIQAGVNAAGGGPSTVTVYPGLYPESVDLSTMATAPGAGGADDIAIVALISGTVSVVPPSGEAFHNSVTPFPFDVEIRGMDVTSATTDAIDLEGTNGSVVIADVVATGATYDGIDVRADGNVTLTNVRSTQNGNDGFQIEIEGTGDLVISDCVASDNGPPTADPLSGDHDGFNIQLLDGSIEIDGSRAERNRGDGFEISPLPGGKIPVLRLTDTTASHNTSDGFQIQDRCGTAPQGPSCSGEDERPIVDITIIRCVADGNGFDGFEIEGVWTDDPAPAVLPRLEIRQTRANGNGAAPDNSSGEGIEAHTGNPDESPGIVSLADVVFEDVTTNGNVADGIQLEGRHQRGDRMNDVTFSDVTSEDNGNDGIEIIASGDVVLTDVQANRNGLYNFADPDEAPDPSRRDGIEINHSNEPDVDTITLMRVTANGNGGEGIDVEAVTRVEASYIEARGNGALVPCVVLPDLTELCEFSPDPKEGFQIDQGFVVDDLDGSQAEVVVSHCILSENTGDGLDVDNSDGDVTVSDCDLNDNGKNGLDAHQESVFGAQQNPQSLDLARITTTGNTDDGVDAAAEDGITMLDVCSADNTSDGIVIKQHGDPVSVTSAALLGNRYGFAHANPGAAAVTLAASDLAGNGVGGAVNETPALTVAATGNYWGAPSGPFHPGGNPGGLGDAVFDGGSGAAGSIDFSGFSATPLLPATCPERGGFLCPCFDSSGPAPLLCFDNHSPSLNAYAWSPGLFLQVTSNWCRSNALFAWLSPREAEACDGQLHNLCD